MDGRLQHAPRTKQQIKDALYAFLYSPAEKHLKKQIDALIIKNAVLCGHSHKSFMYKNTLYNCDTNPLPRKMNRLDSRLYAEMGEYLAEVKQLNKELPYVIGYINQVLNASNDLRDYLRLLPDAVHRPVQSLIATRPCKAKKMSQEAVSLLQEKNSASIDMLRRRMVTNLLI